MTRQYRKKRRAEKEEQTRQRIARAAMELHEEIGPARTTIRAIAERAGVQRLTVYRHFPDERSMFQACSGLYSSLHPMPDASLWFTAEDPRSQLRAALSDLYPFYAETEPMMEKTFRDAAEVTVLTEFLAPEMEQQKRLASLLCEGWQPPVEQRHKVESAINHAMSFHTWQSLVRHNQLSVSDAIDLMVGMVTAVVDETERHTNER